MATVPMLSTIADQTASQIAGAVSSLMPSGVMLPFGGTTAPTGWLLCDGSPISRTTYAALFSAIGTTHGTGDGVNTFNLPDMRGVFPRGAGTNGTSNYGGVTGHTPAGGSVGAKGGQKTAKNGLAAASSSTSVSGNRNQFDRTSGTVSSDHGHNFGSGGMSANASHGHTWTPGSGTAVTNAYAGFSTVVSSPNPGVAYNNNVGGQNTDHTHSGTTGGINTNHTHNINYDSTFSASGTAAAQAITGDTETTPASLTLHYIIKI